MNTDKEINFQIVVNHYEIACKDVRAQIKVRNRLLVYTFISFLANLLRLFGKSSNVVLTIPYITPPIEINGILFNCISCSIWLYVSVRYLQANICENKQYDYIRKLENELDLLLGEKLFARVESSDLTESPPFSVFVKALYVQYIPQVIFLASLFLGVGYAFNYYFSYASKTEDNITTFLVNIFFFILSFFCLAVTVNVSLSYMGLIKTNTRIPKSKIFNFIYKNRSTIIMGTLALVAIISRIYLYINLTSKE